MIDKSNTQFSWESCLVVTFENGISQEMTLDKIPRGKYNVNIIYQEKDQEMRKKITPPSIDFNTLYERLYNAKFGRGGLPTDKYVVSLADD